MKYKYKLSCFLSSFSTSSMIKLTQCSNPWSGSLTVCGSLHPSQWRWTRSRSRLLKISPSPWIWKNCNPLMKHWSNEARRWSHDRKEQTRTYLPKVRCISNHRFNKIVFPFFFIHLNPIRTVKPQQGTEIIIRASKTNCIIKGQQQENILFLLKHV